MLASPHRFVPEPVFVAAEVVSNDVRTKSVDRIVTYLGVSSLLA